MHPPVEKSPAFSALSGVHHGFFGRQGGVSDGDFASLNASLSVGDDRANVIENIHKAVMALKSGARPIALVKQVHGTNVLTVTEDTDFSVRIEADAIVTARRGVALGILTADCAPVLFADAQAGVIGAAHAGWRGAVDGIVSRTVEAMVALGASVDRITSAIGPAISLQNYEVGTEFAETILSQYPDAAPFLVSDGYSTPHFDVVGLVVSQAESLGIQNIDSIGACTYSNPDHYFSHRFATHRKIRTGRQIALISRD